MTIYTQTFYKLIRVYFYSDRMILLIKIHASCMYLFTKENVADVKLETDIVEKRLFGVKEKTTYYTLSLTTIMLPLRKSCNFCNERTALKV